MVKPKAHTKSTAQTTEASRDTTPYTKNRMGFHVGPIEAPQALAIGGWAALWIPHPAAKLTGMAMMIPAAVTWVIVGAKALKEHVIDPALGQKQEFPVVQPSFN
eukprot:g10820.t1